MFPDFKTFSQLSQKYSLVPTFLERTADLETPVTVYLKVGISKPYSALLESVEGLESLARHSFIAVSHHFRFESLGSEVRLFSPGKNSSTKEILMEKKKQVKPFKELKKFIKKYPAAILPELPSFCGGAIGYASYDMARNFEKLPQTLESALHLPEALFLLTDECIVFDHKKHKLYLIKWNLIKDKSQNNLLKLYKTAEKSLNTLSGEIKNKKVARIYNKKGNYPSMDKIVSNFSKVEFCTAVVKCKEYIRAGDVIQTVLSQRFELESDINPFQVYRALRMVNPSPYLYYLNLNNFSVAGSSPEILVRKQGNCATVRPIAGTRRRGQSLNEDLAFEKELIKDEKEKAEHLMLVDLGRNDLGRCCQSGSVKVENFMKVERYSHVMHLVSTVNGELEKGKNSFDLFQACFPAGTVTGAPKIRAMEIIEELEKIRRGLYAGSVGYFSYSGDMDMAITIRTILFNKKKIYMQAGAGIVADSIPEREEKETRSKVAALFKAVELAQSGNL